MLENFVSISAISTKEQLFWISKICRNEKIDFPIAIGYQVSNKSINQGTQNSRQPSFSLLGDLDKKTRDYGFITSIHYYTKDNKTILSDLEKIIKEGVSSSSLLQFNTLPIESDDLNRIKEMGFKIIFKVAVSDKSSSEKGYSVWKGESVQDVETGEIAPLIKQVYDRRNFIDYVMFDPSHGTNLTFNLNETSLAVKFGKSIITNSNLYLLGLVYAGGINPNNVSGIVTSLNRFFPGRYSIDVESGVRTDDSLDLNLVKDYLINCKRNMKN